MIKYLALHLAQAERTKEVVDSAHKANVFALLPQEIHLRISASSSEFAMKNLEQSMKYANEFYDPNPKQASPC